MASFVAPKVIDNPDGWGPTAPPSQFKGLPFVPFNKSEKLGKAADWSGQGRGGGRPRQQEVLVNTAIYFTHENEDDFQLVDLSKPQKRYPVSRRFQQIKQQQMQRRRREEQAQQQQQQQQQQKRTGKQRQQQPRTRYTTYRRWGAYQYDNKPVRDASVHVRKDWQQVGEFEFSTLQKTAAVVNPPEDLRLCGVLQYYDDAYDRVTTRTERPLERHDRSFFNVTTSDDPVIQELAESEDNHIFITDTILSVIMCATRSVYPWDLLIHKINGKIFFDKRENSFLDYLTVNETAAQPPTDEKEDKTINCAQALSREATYINQSFSQQVLTSQIDPVRLEHPNPFVTQEDERPASIGYRYRRFKLGDENLIVRCELDGVQGTKEGKSQYLTIKTLNEYDPKKEIDWRQKLDTQRGAVLATELKNNSNKLARWTIQSILAGTTTIKLGFVSRANPRSQANHTILGTQFYKPREFATQINLNVKNAWGVFKTITDALIDVDDGDYVLLKDPNKSILRLYAVNENAFDREEEEEADTDMPVPSTMSGMSGVGGGGVGGSGIGIGIVPTVPHPSVSIVEKPKGTTK